MEFEVIKKYETSPLVGNINGNLPLNEFVQGNFSNADSIITLYKTLLQQCFTQSMKEFTRRDDGNRHLYRDEKLEKLAKQKSILTEAYQTIQGKIQTLQNRKKEILTPIKNKHKDHNGWIVLCRIINKSLDTFPHLNEIKNTTKDPWKQRILDIRNDIENIIEINNSSYPLEQERNKIRHDLDRKDNPNSVVAQINNFSDGTEGRLLKNHISNKIKRIFSGSEFSQNEVSNIYTYFNEVLGVELCKHTFLDENTYKRILRTHTDKVGVFEYFYSLYSKGSSTMRDIHEFKNKEEATKAVVEKLHSYNKILKKNYHWSTQISQDDINFIEEILLSKKKGPRYQYNEGNQRLDNIFRLIAELDLEGRPGDFEKTIEAIRNTDYYNYFQNKSYFFDILVFIYTSMDEDEKIRINESYKSYSLFEKIYNTYVQEKKIQDSKQLILFAFTDDDNRNNRIRVLQEQIKTSVSIPDTLGKEEYKILETIVFASNKTKIATKYKSKQATIDNRKNSREYKQIIWQTFLERVIEQEILGRKSFPRAIHKLQQHIIRNKEPLYTQFPILNEQIKKED